MTAPGGNGGAEAPASYGALSDEAGDLADLLRGLQDDFSCVPSDALPAHILLSAQALDRACQTLDDFGAIFARLHEIVAAHGPASPCAAAFDTAVQAARQDHLRRRLTARDGGDHDDPGHVELF